MQYCWFAPPARSHFYNTISRVASVCSLNKTKCLFSSLKMQKPNREGTRKQEATRYMCQDSHKSFSFVMRWDFDMQNLIFPSCFLKRLGCLSFLVSILSASLSVFVVVLQESVCWFLQGPFPRGESTRCMWQFTKRRTWGKKKKKAVLTVHLL